MFDIVDTAFSNQRELIIWSFLQGFSKIKKVACNLSAMHILRFYFVGKICLYLQY